SMLRKSDVRFLNGAGPGNSTRLPEASFPSAVTQLPPAAVVTNAPPAFPQPPTEVSSIARQASAAAFSSRLVVAVSSPSLTLTFASSSAPLLQVVSMLKECHIRSTRRPLQFLWTPAPTPVRFHGVSCKHHSG